jgi:hypothetical protein
MARVSKAERLVQVHREALKSFNNIQVSVKDERIQCLADRRFYSIAGSQWEGDFKSQFENRPRLEVNKVHLGVMRIINEYRNNRITVDFLPKDGASDEGLADTCDGLYRADEQDSCADEAYDNAFEEAVGGGFGAWRLRTEYEDEEDDEDERQRIRIEPIYDADKFVFFDLNAKRQDKSDARFCYVLTAMSYEAYEEEYGVDPASMPTSIEMTEFDWQTPDVVYVAEYYRVEEKSETVRIFQTLDGSEERYTERDFEEDENLERMLAATGATEVRQKRVKRRKVRKYIMNGSEVLEDLGYIAGNQIPIIPVYGKRWYIDNRERMMGHVRMVKDAQRLKNMQLSRLAEISAYSAVQKPIFSPEQVAGHEVAWAEDNVKNNPYLLINPIMNADGAETLQGPADYVRAPDIPPAMAALLQVTEQDMIDLLGKQDAADELQTHMSGKAIEMIQTRLDHLNFIYMSNMAKAIKRSGEVWLSMARDVLVEDGRKMKTMSMDGEIGQVELARPVLDDAGAVAYENDMSNAKFDVAVDVGPSSASKRAGIVRSVTGMLQLATDPETQSILTSMALMNMEGEGLADTRKYFRMKLVRMGVVEPTQKEAEMLQAEAQNQQPDPNAMYLQAAAAESQAKAVKTEAETAHVIAKTAETEAKTTATLANIESQDRNDALKALKEMREPVGR